VYTGFWCGNLKERNHLEELSLDGRVILTWIFKKLGMDWINLARYRERWVALVNAVMNFRVPNGGNFLTR